MQFAVDLADRSFDFRMSRMTDEDQRAALGHVSAPLNMDFGDQRTGRIDGMKGAGLRLGFHVTRNAVGAEDRHGARGHFVQIFDEANAFRPQGFHDMPVVNDFVAHIDGGAVFGERPLDDIDRSDNARAKPTRLSKYDLH